jgi:hypothetical protein
VRLPAEALSLLETRYLVRTSDRWVFATKNGTPYRPRNVERWILKVREQGATRGVPLSKTFHSTRHFWVSGAVAAGWDWESIRGQAAHHSAAFTAKVYSHGTGREHSLDFAVTVVTDRSQRSQEDIESVYTETPNQTSLQEKMERETGFEPIGSTASAPSAWETSATSGASWAGHTTARGYGWDGRCQQGSPREALDRRVERPRAREPGR